MTWFGTSVLGMVTIKGFLASKAFQFDHFFRRIPKVYILYLLILLTMGQIWKRYKPRQAELDTDGVVIWANDFHISPIHDLKMLIKQFNSSIIDMSLSGHCHLTHTCQNSLKVINKQNGMDLSPDLIPKFYEAYKDDPLMKRVDAYVCFHPSSMCELFIPFKKPLLVIASTRYELGRFKPQRWKQWNENLIKISKDPRNVVGANNLYDLEYIRYFTGIKGTLLPSFCDYTNVTYTPRPGEPFLLAPVHKPGFQEYFLKSWDEYIGKTNGDVKLKPLRSVYSSYKYSNLTRHPGIVYIPYQVSTMSLFEQYRMNIPLFFPSLDLLAKWQFEHMVMTERTWDAVFGKRPTGSRIKGVLDVPDPNIEFNYEAIKYWIKFADFYQWPHITYYDSVEDLIKKMKTVNLSEISANMKIFNRKAKKDLVEKWKGILHRINEKQESRED